MTDQITESDEVRNVEVWMNGRQISTGEHSSSFLDSLSKMSAARRMDLQIVDLSNNRTDGADWIRMESPEGFTIVNELLTDGRIYKPLCPFCDNEVRKPPTNGQAHKCPAGVFIAHQSCRERFSKVTGWK